MVGNLLEVGEDSRLKQTSDISRNVAVSWCNISPFMTYIDITLTSGWWFGTSGWNIFGTIIPTDSYFSEGFNPPTSITLTLH